MMTKQGGVFLVDFGLAKLADGKGNITRLGGAGTPNYMAPEQKRGGEIDQRSDVYAIGVMTFEMLTGELPKLTMASQLNPKLNSKVDDVLTKAMASEPAERYGNILDFIEDLEEALTVKKVTPKEEEATLLEAATVLEQDVAMVRLIHPSTNGSDGTLEEMELLAVHGRSFPEESDPIVTMEAVLAQEAIKTRQLCLSDDLPSEETTPLLERIQIQHFYCIPIQADQRILGLITAGSASRDGRPRSMDRAYVLELGNRLADYASAVAQRFVSS